MSAHDDFQAKLAAVRMQLDQAWQQLARNDELLDQLAATDNTVTSNMGIG